MEIVIATKNQGKVKELEDFLANLPFKLRSLNDFPNVSEPAETGATFAENAILKARSYARQTGLWALADDSGLEVAALDGAPGVFSARYGGDNASDGERIDKLLGALKSADADNRTARFVCVMAIADAQGEIKCIAEGVCDGRLTESPKGANGFGYDPIFAPQNYAKTFGELSGAVKQKISHRAQATRKIIAYLRDFIVVST